MPNAKCQMPNAKCQMLKCQKHQLQYLDTLWISAVWLSASSPMALAIWPTRAAPSSTSSNRPSWTAVTKTKTFAMCNTANSSFKCSSAVFQFFCCCYGHIIMVSLIVTVKFETLQHRKYPGSSRVHSNAPSSAVFHFFARCCYGHIIMVSLGHHCTIVPLLLIWPYYYGVAWPNVAIGSKVVGTALSLNATQMPTQLAHTHAPNAQMLQWSNAQMLKGMV